LFNTASFNFVKNLSTISTDLPKENRTISKSYTKDAMALCVSDAAKIGIDIEKKLKRSPETIIHFVKKYITFQIKSIPSDMNEQWFYKAWTAMESYFKLAGKGFSTPKNFVLDIEQQLILHDGKQAAWLEYFNIGNFVICICSDTAFSKQDVQISFHGWEG